MPIQRNPSTCAAKKAEASYRQSISRLEDLKTLESMHLLVLDRVYVLIS